MCGIAGLVSTRRGEFRQPVEAMVRALAHRGPDDEGIVVLDSAAGPGTVVLGARRLAILDRSPAGHQPMHDPRTGHWMVYNGEVYNFQSLRAGLDARGIRCVSSGDTEVLLKSYGAEGATALAQWHGMFAVAIWDAPRRQLFLARDRLGIKPLYYWQGDGLFLFASEVRALLASGLVPRRLAPDGVATFLSFGAVQDPVTIIDGVQAVLPGHHVTVAAGQVTEIAYWHVPSPEASRPPRPREALVEDLCARLEASVTAHLVSDVPVGVFLSGGIDSSVVAALAQRHATAPISTWTVAFDAPGANEGPQAATVARALGSRHQALVVDAARMRGWLLEATCAMDQPTIDGLNSYVISRAAREAGLVVALSGLGGDELFGGYSTFHRSLRCRRTPRLARRVIAALATRMDRRMDRRERWALLGAWEQSLGHPLLGLRMVYGPRAMAQVLGRPARDLTVSWGPFAEVLRRVLTASAAHDPITQVSALELQLYLPNTLLRDTDAMSMAHGLEVRVPLLDDALVAWALGVPGAAKLGAGPKPLLAGALQRLAPSITIPRTKRGFVVPLARWLAEEEVLRGPVDATFRDVDRWRRAGLDAPAAQAVWQQFLDGRCGWAPPWALFVLSQWVETHLA